MKVKVHQIKLVLSKIGHAIKKKKVNYKQKHQPTDIVLHATFCFAKKNVRDGTEKENTRALPE